MIRMPCPQCAAPLELDEGFVGGMARCRRCNAMFTVPGDAAGEPPAVLEHEEVAAPVRLPAAPRHTVRTAVLTAAVLLLLLALGGAAGLIVLSRLQPTPAMPPAERVAVARETTENPGEPAGFRVRGIPLDDRTAVVVDAHYLGSGWMEALNAALLEGLTRPGAGARFNLIYAADPSPMMLGASWVDGATVERRTLEALMSRVTTEGTPSLADAVRLAARLEPERMVLIVGRALTNDEAAALRDAVEGAAGRLDVVMIDKDDAALEALAADSGGAYVTIGRGEIGE